ncbi:MAG: MYG1 family protein [Candidatus Magasanikbacteria bacterium]|nr:MYG1 family protein [Candidatus Magasanikbacteria bacterium]
MTPANGKVGNFLRRKIKMSNDNNFVAATSTSTVMVGTHNGVFHADDVFSIASLRLALGEIKIIRTRNPEVLMECDIRVDVGGKDFPDNGDFDHHQRGGAGFRENGIPYASFGLIWKSFGLQISQGDKGVADLVERNLVMPVDAGDCGHTFYEVNGGGVLPNTISNMISSLNPSWQEEGLNFDACFKQAVEMAEVLLRREIVKAQGEVLARKVVREAISGAEDSRLVVLDRFCPWQEVVVTESDALFVLFPAPTGDWRIQCVPPTLGSFGKRKPLPEAWAGKRGEELAKMTGVVDAIFVHIGLFIGGAQSREGILRLAELALAAE